MASRNKTRKSFDFGVWLMVLLAFTALGAGLGYAIASRESTQVTNAAALQHEIASLTNRVQSLQLEIEKARREGRPPVKPNPIPVEKPVVITKEPEPLVQRAIDAIIGPEVEILEAVALGRLNLQARSPFTFLVISLRVKNSGAKALGSQQFYVRLSDGDRTVPIGDVVKDVEIPGGVEPGETKTVSFTLYLSQLNVDDPPFLPSLPSGTHLEVSVVHKRQFQQNKEYYEMFSNVARVPMPYRLKNENDPNMQILLGL